MHFPLGNRDSWMSVDGDSISDPDMGPQGDFLKKMDFRLTLLSGRRAEEVDEMIGHAPPVAMCANFSSRNFSNNSSVGSSFRRAIASTEKPRAMSWRARTGSIPRARR